jgi:hypothetical protein
MRRNGEAAVADEVRYKAGGNKVLRHVLRQVWELRCYWCRNFKDYLELQIDHILPQDSTDEERARLKREFKLPADYDIHAVYNLAPICGDCNGLKGGADLTDIPAVASKLKLARSLAPTVTKRVQTFGRASKLGEALLLAAEVDLTKKDTRATFEEGAPDVVSLPLAQLRKPLHDGLGGSHELRSTSWPQSAVLFAGPTVKGPSHRLIRESRAAPTGGVMTRTRTSSSEPTRRGLPRELSAGRATIRAC